MSSEIPVTKANGYENDHIYTSIRNSCLLHGSIHVSVARMIALMRLRKEKNRSTRKRVAVAKTRKPPKPPKYVVGKLHVVVVYDNLWIAITYLS